MSKKTPSKAYVIRTLIYYVYELNMAEFVFRKYFGFTYICWIFLWHLIKSIVDNNSPDRIAFFWGESAEWGRARNLLCKVKKPRPSTEMALLSPGLWYMSQKPMPDGIYWNIVTKFFVLDVLSPKENYPQLIQIYKKSAFSFSDVKKWPAGFIKL